MKTMTRNLMAAAALAFAAVTTLGASAAGANEQPSQNEITEVFSWVNRTYTAPITAVQMHYYSSLLNEKNDPYCYSADNSVERAHVADQMEWFLYSYKTQVHTRPTTLKVDMIYGVVLNRVPDAAGRAYWEGQLNGGTPWQTMVDSLVFSAEFNTVKVNGTWDPSC